MSENTENSFSDELSYWKSKCIDMEQRIEKHIDESSPSKEDTHNKKSLLLRDEVVAMKQQMFDMERRWSCRFQSLSEQHAISDQYSRKNSLIIRGYKTLPKLTGYDFIKATANELRCIFLR